MGGREGVWEGGRVGWREGRWLGEGGRAWVISDNNVCDVHRNVRVRGTIFVRTTIVIVFNNSLFFVAILTFVACISQPIAPAHGV